MDDQQPEWRELGFIGVRAARARLDAIKPTDENSPPVGPGLGGFPPDPTKRERSLVLPQPTMVDPW